MVPILLITFNRPEHTKLTLERILESNPKSVFIFQDAPRSGVELDVQRCEEVKRVINKLTNGIDFILHTFFSVDNLGCGTGPKTAIDWFFSQVDEGIVMEDDCLPHPDFFKYCEELLDRYRTIEEVRFINSTLYDDRWKCTESYGFSHYMVTGAWAGWKRTWEGFDLDLKGISAQRLRKHILKLTDNRAEANWWYSIVKEIQQDKSKKSYWDYQMQIYLFINNALTIHPCVNLITNIGFDGQGTHTLDNNDQRGGRPSYSIMPLTHPASIRVDKARDKSCWAKARSKGWLNDNVNYWYQRLLWSKGLGHKILMAYKKIKGVGVNTYKV